MKAHCKGYEEHHFACVDKLFIFSYSVIFNVAWKIDTLLRYLRIHDCWVYENKWIANHSIPSDALFALEIGHHICFKRL